jgi:signal recognition particle receptor subunit beta
MEPSVPTTTATAASDEGSLSLVYHYVEALEESFGLPAPQLIALIVGGLLALLFLLRFIFSKGLSSGGNAFLFLGLSGSGKTALLCWLKDGTLPETVTSIKENDCTFTLGSKGTSVRVVDFPGNQRLRSRLETFLPAARGIVYLIDSVESRAQLAQNAQFLFDLFTNKTQNKRRTPILIACNKTEMITAKSKDVIQSELEKELDELRQSSARGTLGDIDKKGKTAEEISLGESDQPFKMEQLPFTISFVECSVKQGEVDAIKDFLSK